jgi:hypothetical protein
MELNLRRGDPLYSVHKAVAQFGWNLRTTTSEGESVLPCIG